MPSIAPTHDGRSGELIAALAACVQRNCDTVDAHHARDSGMCTYLLGMREYYRWRTGQPQGAPVERGAVGSWITRTEEHWDALIERAAGLEALPLGDGLDPYDEAGVNRWVGGEQVVYGAGVGRFGVPLFFLAECESVQVRDGVRIVVAGRELARGFVATPAVSRASSIVVRLDALRRWLWTRVEAAASRGAADPFNAAFGAYAHPGADTEAIEAMARGELETLILHELGEVRAGQLLGPDWECMLAALSDRRSEVILRAVRDLLADCLVTLPALLERRAAASLDFWFSNFDGVRRALDPQLASARPPGAAQADMGRLEQAVTQGREHWRARALELLARWREGGRDGLIAACQSACVD
jgi:hypothetical protein